MIAQRVGVSALRHAATKQPNAFSQDLPRLALAVRASTNLQIRPVSTSKITETDAQSLLASQRRNRPVAPHLSIYDPTQTWVGASIMTRFTGAIFSGGMYIFATAYLTAPLLGWHLESASIAAAFGSLPVFAKGSLKFLAAWPFVFHGLNGIRHLVWDFAKGFQKSTINKGGYTIGAASVVTALGLAFLL